jgi:thiol-disulfide isomerase/thioredoxin
VRSTKLAVGFAIAVCALSVGFGAIAGEPQPFGRGDWQVLRQAHAGRPTIVHLWGLTCGPCRIEMPQWGAFAREHPEVALITIHAERLPPDGRLVREMLEEAGLLPADNRMFDDDSLERLRREIDPAWRGELPVTLLIGRDGGARMIVGSADFEAVRAWLAAQTSDAR